MNEPERLAELERKIDVLRSRDVVNGGLNEKNRKLLKRFLQQAAELRRAAEREV